MTENRERFPYDLDEIAKILGAGTEDEVKKLSSLLMEHGMEQRDVERAVEAQRLRRAVHKEQTAALHERIKKGIVVTPEELDVGAFMERIEPQVRDAIREVRRKGYNTTCSGFSDFNWQSIVFAEPYFSNLDEAVMERLTALGVRIKGGKSLSFEPDSVDMESIKKQWDDIVAALPDRGTPSPPATVRTAMHFRRKFEADGTLKPEWKERYARLLVK